MRNTAAASIFAAVCAAVLLAGCGGSDSGAAKPEPMGMVVSLSADSGQTEENRGPEEQTAVYLGVKNYGAKETNKDHRDTFLYRFQIDGAEVCLPLWNGTKDENGQYDYPLQNQLKEGYSYRVSVQDGTVTAVREIQEPEPDVYSPRVAGVPGERTVKNFLKTAMEPVGTTLYIYGGGWDWQDQGAAAQARTLGVSPDWVRFFNSQNANYTYKAKDGDPRKANPAASYYPYGGYNEYYYAGLDCSGYLGWVLYNTMETESGGDGYVGYGMVKKMAERGWGSWTRDVKASGGGNRVKPGDVMSIKGHVWIALGTCGDGSVVLVHSTPSYSRNGQPGGGVQIGAVGYSKTCEAYRLAQKYMSEQFPAWYERYSVYLCSPRTYFAVDGVKTGKFSWNTEGGDACLTDPDQIRSLRPAEVLAELFGA